MTCNRSATATSEMRGKAWNTGLLSLEPATESVQRDEVQVWIELEVGRNPLHDGHGAAVLAERRLGWHRAPTRSRARIAARLRTLALFATLSPLLMDPFARVAGVHGRSLETPCAFVVRRSGLPTPSWSGSSPTGGSRP